jgi:hypothetical protein
MKRIIITLSVAGFTVVGNNTSSKEKNTTTEQSATSANYNGSNESNDKRFANWD